MLRQFLKSKIHRATITEADVDYEGSLTLPPSLLEAAEIAPYEAVHIWNVTRGTRVMTYAIVGEPGSTICANGAAAHQLRPGDIVIIAAFGYLHRDEIPDYHPTVVFVDADNMVTHVGQETPGAKADLC